MPRSIFDRSERLKPSRSSSATHIILIVAASLPEAPQLFTDVMHRNIKSQKKEKEVPLQQFYPLREMFHYGTKTIVVFFFVVCG